MSKSSSHLATSPGKPVGGHQFLTVAEVARILRVSIDTVWRMVRENRILHTRLGANKGSIRIPLSALNALLVPPLAPNQRPTRVGRSSPQWIRSLQATP